MNIPPSPPLSHSSPDNSFAHSENGSNTESTEHELNRMTMDYMDPMSFVGLEQWAQEGNLESLDILQIQEPGWNASPSLLSTCSPSDTLAFTPFNQDQSFQYDFSFGNGGLSLPSPPATHSSVSDPPSPMRGFAAPNNTFAVAGFHPSTMNLPLAVMENASSGSSTPSQGVKRSHAAANGRTKTSHTTIERRYRTNLNAQLIRLRAAVPALRVLDKNIPAPEGVVDAMDERGYVDGVKAAKKISKATILSKGTEYITVLKRRESRLRREIDGLKSIIISFIPEGGDAFIAKWVENHQAQFGGEPSDELPPGEEQEDEEDEEAEDAQAPKDEEPESKPAKKPKVKPVAQTGTKSESKKPSAPIVLGPDGEPIKRKRGRPRKVQPPPPDTESAELASAAGQQPLPPSSEPQFKVEPQLAVPAIAVQPAVQPARYLLAAFAFFSLFSRGPNYAATSGPGMATHEGSVMNRLPVTVSARAPAWINDEFVRVLHIVTSLLLLLSIAAPYLPRRIRSAGVIRLLTIQPDDDEKAAMTGASCSIDVDSPFALVREYIYYIISRPHTSEITAYWKRYAGKVALDDGELSWIARFRFYYALASIPEAGAEHALLAFPIFPVKASRLWEELREAQESSAALFDGSVQEARAVLAHRQSATTESDDMRSVLLKEQIINNLRLDAEEAFSKCILGVNPKRSQGHVRHSTRDLIAIDRKLTRGEYDVVLEVLDDIPTSVANNKLMTLVDKSNPTKAIRDLVRASQLYLSLNPGNSLRETRTPLSPPPSPSAVRHHEVMKRKRELRCLLAEEAFDADSVEVAKDAAVDFLTQ